MLLVLDQKIVYSPIIAFFPPGMQHLEYPQPFPMWVRLGQINSLMSHKHSLLLLLLLLLLVGLAVRLLVGAADNEKVLTLEGRERGKEGREEGREGRKSGQSVVFQHFSLRCADCKQNGVETQRPQTGHR